jgi:hypothetical protein
MHKNKSSARATFVRTAAGRGDTAVRPFPDAPGQASATLNLEL